MRTHIGSDVRDYRLFRARLDLAKPGPARGQRGPPRCRSAPTPCSVETTLFGARLPAARAPAGHPWAVEVRGQALRVVRLGALAVRGDGLDASSLAVAMRPPRAKPLPSLVGNTQTPRAAFSRARALPLDARVAGGIVPALTLTGLGGLLAAWSAGFVGPTLAPWVPSFVWGGVGGWVAWGVTRAWRRA